MLMARFGWRLLPFIRRRIIAGAKIRRDAFFVEPGAKEPGEILARGAFQGRAAVVIAILGAAQGLDHVFDSVVDVFTAICVFEGQEKEVQFAAGYLSLQVIFGGKGKDWLLDRLCAKAVIGT